jgi:glycosyltransferase involved in cell wall biosynthesis
MVTGAYFPELSGAGLQCRSLIRAASACHLRFSVVTTCRDRNRPFRDTVDGVPVYRLPVHAGPARTLLAWLPRLAYLALAVLPRAGLIHLHGFSRKSWFFLLWSLLTGKPTALKLTSLGEDDPQSLDRRGGLDRFFYRRAGCYIAPSPALQKACLAAGFSSGRLICLPNGVDTHRFRPADRTEKLALRARLGLPVDQVLVFFTGHYSADKRPDFLAEVWSELAVKGVGLVLVGRTDPSGYEVSPGVTARVRAAADKAGSPGSLVAVERTDTIEDYFRACDIFCLPSVREGLPNALLEAMACGLACVATCLPGITDYLLEETGSGLLFEPDDRAALKAALECLCTDQSLRESLGPRARRTVCAEYALDRVALRYREFCLQVTGKTRD